MSGIQKQINLNLNTHTEYSNYRDQTDIIKTEMLS